MSETGFFGGVRMVLFWMSEFSGRVRAVICWCYFFGVCSRGIFWGGVNVHGKMLSWKCLGKLSRVYVSGSPCKIRVLYVQRVWFETPWLTHRYTYSFWPVIFDELSARWFSFWPTLYKLKLLAPKYTYYNNKKKKAYNAHIAWIGDAVVVVVGLNSRNLQTFIVVVVMVVVVTVVVGGGSVVLL